MARNLFPGFVEHLNEFTGEICALVISIVCHLTNLAIGPIASVGRLSDVMSGQVLVIHLLLEFAVGSDGSHLDGFFCSVVVGFNSSAHPVLLHNGMLC